MKYILLLYNKLYNIFLTTGGFIMNGSLLYRNLKRLIFISGVIIILLVIISYPFLPNDIAVQIGTGGSLNTMNKFMYTILNIIISTIFILRSKQEEKKSNIIGLLIGNVILMVLGIIVLCVNL